MFKQIKKVIGTITLALGLSLVPTLSVGAHVVVQPGEAVTADYVTFTILVPNERDIPTTSVKLLIPDSLSVVMPNTDPSWTVTTETKAHAEDAGEAEEDGHAESPHITSITWSNGSVPAGQIANLKFLAAMPEDATDLQWKAYQTYADGTVVSWDQEGEGSGEENTGPFSVTKVVAETEAGAAQKRVEQAAADADKAADRALYVGIAAAVLGIAGIGLALRKQ